MVKKVKNNSISATKNNPVTFTQSITTGPIPSPDVLSQYEAFMPGLANRIVTMAESEVSHRHNIELGFLELNKKALHVEYSERRIGQWLGFCIGTLGLAASLAALALGYENASMVLGGSTVVGLVTVFVVGRFKKDSSSSPLPPENQ